MEELINTKSILNHNPQDYNLSLAEALKEFPEFEAPEWSKFVKSGVSKERPIEEPDFWYKRTASILRQIYKNKTVGVNRFKTRFGSKKNRGMRPEEFRRASGKIIRVILQQCDKAGFTEIFKGKKDRSGRKLTAKGKEFLENIKVKKMEVKNKGEVK
jgi:small subunit ribosomal protein S19e